MDPILLVSPHLDDAVLGAGEFIASWPGATVATVCAGIPDEQLPLTTYDRDSGWKSGRAAMMGRRREDQRALHALRAQPVHLDLLDCQYRGNVPNPVEDIIEALWPVVMELQPVKLLTVLGLEHPDHVATHDAVLALARGLWEPPEVVVWEEIPHRVQWPEMTVDRVRGLAHGAGGEPVYLGGDQMAAKQRAMREYQSQLWALELRSCWVPERFWRVPL
jgi:LmbE family N-acetylglucosaminyl deacetylase